MQRYKIGSGTIFATRWTPAACGEQQFLQTRLVALGCQRPAYLGGGKPLQITVHRRLTDVAAPSDLILPQAEIVSEAKYLFDLPHGHPFLGHEISSTPSGGTSVPGCPASPPR